MKNLTRKSHHCVSFCCRLYILDKKVQVGNDQEKAQSERDTFSNQRSSLAPCCQSYRVTEEA